MSDSGRLNRQYDARLRRVIDQLKFNLKEVEGALVILIDSVQEDVVNVADDVTTVQGRITEIASSISTIESSITTIEGQIADLDDRVTAIEEAPPV